MNKAVIDALLEGIGLAKAVEEKAATLVTSTMPALEAQAEQIRAAQAALAALVAPPALLVSEADALLAEVEAEMACLRELPEWAIGMEVADRAYAVREAEEARQAAEAKKDAAEKMAAAAEAKATRQSAFNARFEGEKTEIAAASVKAILPQLRRGGEKNSLLLEQAAKELAGRGLAHKGDEWRLNALVAVREAALVQMREYAASRPAPAAGNSPAQAGSPTGKPSPKSGRVVVGMGEGRTPLTLSASQVQKLKVCTLSDLKDGVVQGFPVGSPQQAAGLKALTAGAIQ